MRLDEDDPVAAWRAHVEKLGARAKLLNDMRIDSLRYRGPGTDLTVGLLPESRWQGCESTTSVDGIHYVANMPTEEVFTTPDCRRTEGTARSTQPLVLAGQIVKGLEVRFENGRIVDVRAEEGASVVEGELASDENAAVPRRGRARRRHVTRRPDRTACSTRRSSTRTRRATSPTAARTPRRSRAA